MKAMNESSHQFKKTVLLLAFYFIVNSGIFSTTVFAQNQDSNRLSAADSINTQNLSLEGAIQLALNNNYGIVIQEKNVEINQILNHWGETGALPTLSISGTGNYQNSEDLSSMNYSGTASLNWTIFRGFGARIQKDMLEEYENLSEGNLTIEVENTIVDVILSYYQILLQQQNMELAEDLMQLSEDRYELTQRQKEIGSSVTYDLLQAQNAYLEDQSNYLSARASYNNAIRQLNYLMAAPLEDTYQFTSDFEADTTHFDRVTLTDRMLENNSTLRNQYINLELAKQQVKSARSNYYPTVSLGASSSYSDTQYYGGSGFSSQRNSGFNQGASLTVSFNLFNGGQRKRALQTAKIEEQISEVSANEMEVSLKNQLFQEHELYQVRKQQLNLARENMEAAELNLELSQMRYENGSINSFNYRDVQQVYAHAVLSYNNAIYNVVESYQILMRLTGGVIEEYE